MADNLYESDFYTWATRQSALLRLGRADQADLQNIAEEIETLGRSEAAALESAYRLICTHLLKATYPATHATRCRNPSRTSFETRPSPMVAPAGRSSRTRSGRL